jgi:hypothetical protein
VDHSEGKSGEKAVTILRFKDGSSHLCRLRTVKDRRRRPEVEVNGN